jgi:hypothetical protein
MVSLHEKLYGDAGNLETTTAFFRHQCKRQKASKEKEELAIQVFLNHFLEQEHNLNGIKEIITVDCLLNYQQNKSDRDLVSPLHDRSRYRAPKPGNNKNPEVGKSNPIIKI